MKSFCFALLFALLFGVVVRADDAEKMDIKCPVKSKFFAKYIDGEKFLKNCNPNKGVTANRCDKCFAFIIKSIAGGVDDAKLDIAKVLDFLGTPDFTIKEKMRAVGEVCSPKMAKALLEKGVKKELVKKATDYPNGKVFKCPTDLAQYPKSIAQFYKNVEGSFGDALTSLFG
eukprot:jgi/Picsp_1/4756/NSC_02124-R1_---NA---